MTLQRRVAAVAAVLGSCPWAAQAARATAETATETGSSTGNIYWEATYGPCDSTCGPGLQQVVSKKCINWAANSPTGLQTFGGMTGMPKEVDERECRNFPEPEAQYCEGFTGCKWSVGASPQDNCGYAEAACWSPEKNRVVDERYCESLESGLADKDAWRSRHALVDSGCAALGANGLNDICIMSVNYDKGFGVTGKVVAEKEAAFTFSYCAGSDVVVISTQELINSLWDYFKNYVKDLEQAAPGYTLVTSCGQSISAAVAVFVKSEKRRFLAPVPNGCLSLPDNDGSKGNTKGSEVGSIPSVLGVISFASTHGARGDTISPKRVEEVSQAAMALMAPNPTIVAWGGDINPRTTGMLDNKALQAAGTTHPDESQASTDRHWELRGSFNPKQTLQILASAPDILGREGETLDQVLQAASGSEIVQAPGIRDLCPSYRKVPGRGKVKQVNVKGTGFKIAGWKVPGTRDVEDRWRPSLACEAGYGEEYYGAELAGVPYGGKKNKSPSWADRIMVSRSMNCMPVQKILVPEDHDSLFVKCTMKP